MSHLPSSSAAPATAQTTRTGKNPYTDQTNTDTNKPSLPYFSKWSRQRIQDDIDKGLIHSLYVENLSPQWKPTDVYRVMSKYGEVVDVYIPKKQSRTGQRFGFVRFQGVRDFQRLLSNVNRVQVEGGMVRANVARKRIQGFPVRGKGEQHRADRQPVRDGRTYARVMKGGHVDTNQGTQGKEEVISFIPSTDINRWLSRCAVGIAKDPKKMESVSLVWKLHNMPEVEVVDMGGDSVLVCFPSSDGMAQFVQEPPEWVSIWFKSFTPWKQGDRAVNRRCWVTIGGVPLNAWCQEFFQLVGSEFGQFLQIDDDTERRRNLGSARLEILTEQEDVINMKLRVTIANQSYSIVVLEDTVYNIAEESLVQSVFYPMNDQTEEE
ncbi:hypothetical protein Tsubulata_007662 [Turnera subulata]|uniref:RRM domain-containing protein n=1 Tax=Turnera subulata TaxID=218843 RepID=A0A9Q0FNB9_9ROSI|nr:hypothetical protein Tsubulata_007662 [Turnera subulata]